MNAVDEALVAQHLSRVDDLVAMLMRTCESLAAEPRESTLHSYRLALGNRWPTFAEARIRHNVLELLTGSKQATGLKCLRLQSADGMVALGLHVLASTEKDLRDEVLSMARR